MAYEFVLCEVLIHHAHRGVTIYGLTSPQDPPCLGPADYQVWRIFTGKPTSLRVCSIAQVNVACYPNAGIADRAVPGFYTPGSLWLGHSGNPWNQ